ncbi:hypothetical protein ACFQ61_10170 [Streptomyces sp. NPDC056500]|uniref:hypothetical protein n=1 Tax=Streptomyces sp. NPDC056500 TaxID=3345840 RepID=UPI0036CE8DF6
MPDDVPVDVHPSLAQHLYQPPTVPISPEEIAAVYKRQIPDTFRNTHQETHMHEQPSQSRRFHLQRHTDVTGASGTGRVADGVLWPDGTVSIRWRGDRPSVVFWQSLADAEAVHGHGGATEIIWADPEPTPAP